MSIWFYPYIPSDVKEGQWHKCEFSFMSNKLLDSKDVHDTIINALLGLGGTIYIDAMSIVSDWELSKFPNEVMIDNIKQRG